MSESKDNSSLSGNSENNISEPESRETSSQTLNDKNCTVFGNDEYHFKNAQEFRSFIERLVNEEKPYEIRSLLNRYKTSLKQFSEKVWGTNSLEELQKTVSGFIRIGEYLFTGEKHFREFMTGILDRGRWDPAFILSFAKAHRDSLDSAAKAFPGIRENVAALYAASDAVIVFDEELFPDLTAFKAFVTDVINRGNANPGYLLEFVKRHRSAIDSLMKNSETKAVLKPLTDLSESFIVFDCHVFTTVPAFGAFIDDIIAAGRNDPDYLCRFVRWHSGELAELRRDGRCEQILNNLDAARNQLVCLDELVFRSVDDFRTFMEQILNSGKENPAYLRRFVREHEKALIALNSVSSLSSVVDQVLSAGNSVIELDEYVFGDAADFAGFVSDLKGESRTKPLRGTDFVREHKAGLEALKGADVLASAVKDLRALENSGETREAIKHKGAEYSPLQFIKFGKYMQQDAGIKEPIEWMVLAVNDQEALLVSRYGLDCRQYHHDWVSMTWENSDLRKWLNHDFIEEAFSKEEQRRIKLAEAVNDANPVYGTSGGNNTQDRVFCLSLEEAKRYFKNDSERMCLPTVHARNNGAWADSSNGGCYWWLRSPGGSQNCVSRVNAGGSLLQYGNGVSDVSNAVRPALWLICNP